MPQSYVEYSSGLTATTYNIPFKFISVNDVNVKGYNGSSWSDNLTVASRSSQNSTITLDAAPSAYQKIRVYRGTSTEQLVDFQNGSRLSESDLDTAYQQGLFVAQEVSENASTEVEGIGPQGPQGIQGPAGADGVDGADGADGVDAVGGKILQVLSTSKTTPFTTTSSSPTDITGMSVNITPSSTTSKILVMFHAGLVSNTSGGQGTELYLVRNAAYIHQGDADGHRVRVTAARNDSNNYSGDSISFQHLDSPNSTNVLTYKVQIATQDGGTACFLRRGDEQNTSSYPRAAAEITVMEIAG